MQVQASQGAHGWRRGVEHGDNGEGPKGAAPGIGDLGDRKEAHDHMGEARGPGHERGGDAKDIEGALRPVRVGPKAQLRDDPVELFQHRDAFPGEGGAEGQLGKGHARDLEGNEDGGHRIGGDEHAVLGHLRIGDALHPPEHGVEKDDGHADDQAHAQVHLEEAGKHNTDAAHLPGHVGKGHKDEAQHGDKARRGGVVAVPDEIGNGELPELSQIGREEQRQKHVAPGPAHKVDRAVVAKEGNEPRHGNKGCGAHPVCRRGHAIGDGMDAASSDVKVPGAGGAGAQGDGDVEGEARPHHEVGQRL